MNEVQEGTYVLRDSDTVITVADPIEYASKVFVVSIFVEGVPLVAGMPNTDIWAVECEQLNCPSRSANTSLGRGAILPVKGATFHHEFFHPVPLGRQTRSKLTRMRFRVYKEDGSPAEFTKLILRVQIHNNRLYDQEAQRQGSALFGQLRDATKMPYPFTKEL